MSYQPPQEILARYADVLVNFALGNDYGINPGETVQIAVPDIAKPLALELQTAVLKSGGHPLVRLVPTGFEKDFFTHANQDQLAFFPKKYSRERVKLLDHAISIIADPHPFELKDIDPQKIMTARDSKSKMREWLFEKEGKGSFTWTLGLWGVQAKADIVGLSLEEYWEQIIKACFLDEQDPVAHWKRLKDQQQATRNALNNLEIEYLTIKGPDADLKVTLGPDRQWKGGADRNIPSFEIFTSPDWRGVEGWIRFNQPVYRYGNMLQDIRLELKNGKVRKATAKHGQQLLDQMLKSKNADKIGEFSLTDKRFSRISHVMAETLYDENIGGPYGNTHLAIGMAYKDCYRGDSSSFTKKDWHKRGFNESPEHTDIVSTTDREVTAHLTDGSSKVIYTAGMFTV